MFVNHSMDQLSNVKDNHVLMEWESMSDVMRVDFVTVQESGSGQLDIVDSEEISIVYLATLAKG